MIHRTRWVLVADLRLDTEMEWAVRNIGDKHHNWPYVGIVIYGVFVSAVVYIGFTENKGFHVRGGRHKPLRLNLHRGEGV